MDISFVLARIRPHVKGSDLMPNPLLGTHTVTQIGILVNDITSTASAFAEFLGVQVPSIIVTDIEAIAKTRYMGKPSGARAKLAFFHVGTDVDIELIEPDQEPSTWRHDLDAHGEGFHHIAFQVKGMKDKNAVLQAHGMPLLQSGEYTGGRYAYHDATGTLKMVLELLEND
jgi:methylmalonyl-CoA/ethylmalonyl-CoA epimerase